MDYLTELENELSNFTRVLYEGLSKVQDEVTRSDKQARNKLISQVGSDIADAHRSILNVITKIPEDLFKQSRENQEAEIRALQEQYESSISKLRHLQAQASFVHQTLGKTLDNL